MLTFETKIHRFGMICPGDPHQRNPNAPKFEDIGLRKGRNGKSDVLVKQRGRLAKHILKLKEKHNTAFFSLSENWCLPAPSTLKPEDREICCRPWSVDAHDQQKGFEFR